MDCYVSDFQEIDQTQLAAVGGKGALWGSSRESTVSACHPAFA
jgi:hypothetical protein